MPGYIDEPADFLESTFFRLSGWVADQSTPVSAIYAKINRKRFELSFYTRPDVVRDYPGFFTTGFSTFVRLADLGPVSTITIEILNADTVILHRKVAVSESALSSISAEEEARQEKLEWLLPRVSCLECGSDLDRDGVCIRCGYRYMKGVMPDFIPRTVEGFQEIEFNGVVCSQGYDGDMERVIAAAEARGGKILDCGAGMRPSCRRSIVTTDIFPYPNIDVLALNQRLPFKDQVFDAVLSCHVLEHVPDPFACAKELYRVLRPQGTLFATTPMIVPEHGVPHHYFNPTREGLARLFGAGADLRVYIPVLGHPINGVWTILGLYRDSLPEPQRSKFVPMTVSDLLSHPIEHWIGHEIASTLNDDGRRRLATAFCVELVRQSEGET